MYVHVFARASERKHFAESPLDNHCYDISCLLFADYTHEYCVCSAAAIRKETKDRKALIGPTRRCQTTCFRLRILC